MALDKAMDYEVKYLLDPLKTLDGFGNLSADVIEKFGMEGFKEIAVQFLETPAREFDGKGWLNRVRNKGKELELTYKKRFDVEETLKKTLQLAEGEGFSVTGDDYAVEVDWGYKKQTLSFGNTKEAGKKFKRLTLPDRGESIELLLDKAPGKWEKCFDRKLLENTRIFGPVIYRKYTGEFEGEEMVIEIWPVHGEYLVEASFKEKKYKAAYKRRELLFRFLDAEGWVLYQDGLKTQAILKEAE